MESFSPEQHELGAISTTDPIVDETDAVETNKSFEDIISDNAGPSELSGKQIQIKITGIDDKILNDDDETTDLNMSHLDTGRISALSNDERSPTGARSEVLKHCSENSKAKLFDDTELKSTRAFSSLPDTPASSLNRNDRLPSIQKSAQKAIISMSDDLASFPDISSRSSKGKAPPQAMRPYVKSSRKVSLSDSSTGSFGNIASANSSSSSRLPPRRTSDLVFMSNTLIDEAEKLLNERKFAEAAKVLESIVDGGLLRHSPQRFLLLLDCFYGMGEYNKAFTVAQSFLRVFPQEEIAHCSIALCLAHTSRGREAVARCTDALRVFPKSTSLYCLRGNIYSELGRIKEATTDFSAARQLEVDNHTIGSAMDTSIVRSTLKNRTTTKNNKAATAGT